MDAASTDPASSGAESAEEPAAPDQAVPTRPAETMPSLEAGGTVGRPPVTMAPPRPIDSPAPATAPDAVSRRLDLARGDAWLDRLAGDIAASASAGGDAPLRFALAPERLGRLTVELATLADGTALRLTAETREAHRVLTGVQPQLVAEARAQGLRITETQVDLDAPGQNTGQPAGQGGDGQPRRFADPQQPYRPDPRAAARTARSSMPADEPGRAASDLYA